MKMIKIAATTYHILKLEYKKIHFSWGSAPIPAGRDYSTPTDLSS